VTKKVVGVFVGFLRCAASIEDTLVDFRPVPKALSRHFAHTLQGSHDVVLKTQPEAFQP
jgi:hypothetical protein